MLEDVRNIADVVELETVRFPVLQCGPALPGKAVCACSSHNATQSEGLIEQVGAATV